MKNSSAKLYPKGTLVVALYGATVGKTGILDFGAASNQAVCAIYPNKEIDRDYMFWFFRQKRQEFIESSFGGAQPNISQKVVKETDIPVPCIEIQKEIVTFLNQCEHEGRIDKKFLDNGVLEQIESFFNVRSCCEELEGSMNMTDSLITTLHQSILHEAVQGKLVPQDPNDEPGNVLLERIRAQKEQLIKEKKIKKEKPLPQITEDEIPYELPQNWEWVRLGDVCTVITDGTHYTPDYVSEGIPFLSVKDISKGIINFSNTKFISIEEHEVLTKRCKPEFEDVLLTKIGTTGIAKVIDTNREFSIFVSVALLKIFKHATNPYFLVHLLNSPLVKKQSADGTEGVGNKNLVLRKIQNFIVPIPPFNEQIRILEKVDQLMALCDELEGKVGQSKQDSEKLMKVVLLESFQSA